MDTSFSLFIIYARMSSFILGFSLFSVGLELEVYYSVGVILTLWGCLRGVIELLIQVGEGGW